MTILEQAAEAVARLETGGVSYTATEMACAVLEAIRAGVLGAPMMVSTIDNNLGDKENRLIAKAVFVQWIDAILNEKP